MAAEMLITNLDNAIKFLVYVTASVGITMGAITLVLTPVSRGGALGVGILGILILLALFAYTTQLIYAVYSQPEIYDLANPASKDLMIRGILLQRVAAAQLAAIFFIAGILAIGYYLEISRRR